MNTSIISMLPLIKDTADGHAAHVMADRSHLTVSEKTKNEILEALNCDELATRVEGQLKLELTMVAEDFWLKVREVVEICMWFDDIMAARCYIEHLWAACHKHAR